MRSRRPLVALTLGDPAGIGPEICAAAIADARVRAAARVVLVGPACERPRGVPPLEDPSAAALEAVEELAFVDAGASGVWRPGAPQESAGRAALAALALGAELARDGLVDALVNAPVSKEALHLAGETVEGQTELLARWADAPETEMLAVAHDLNVVLLTRHRALRDALDAIAPESILARLRLLARELPRLGRERPRLAVAGLNPHAGEGGLFGDEEERLVAPAVEAARAEGLDVVGPLSPDTVFVRASRGAFDAVVALYHDQAFLPVKMHAPNEGLTVLLGLPYLRVSPAHGTAFDVAGRGVADPTNLIVALERAAQLAPRYSAARARQ